MKLKSKITAGAVLLAAIPVLVASMVIGTIVSDKSNEALNDAARSRLIAVRDLSKGRIEDYFSTIRKQMLTFSKDRMTVDAMNAFARSFARYREDVSGGNLTTQGIELGSYYSDDFSREYARRNPGKQVDTARWVAQLDADSVALQYRFIKANPHPLGEKHMLDDPGDGSMYASTS